MGELSRADPKRAATWQPVLASFPRDPERWRVSSGGAKLAGLNTRRGAVYSVEAGAYSEFARGGPRSDRACGRDPLEEALP